MADKPTDDEFENRRRWHVPFIARKKDENVIVLRGFEHERTPANERSKLPLTTNDLPSWDAPVDVGQDTTSLDINLRLLSLASHNTERDSLRVFISDMQKWSTLSVGSSTGAIADGDNKFLDDRDHNELDFDVCLPDNYETLPAHTDSGYASLPHNSKKLNLDLQTDASAELDTDNATVYSAMSSIGVVTKNSYIEAIAQLLWEEVNALQTDDLPTKEISNALCDLLSNFALRIGGNAQDDMHRRIMIFVHKHRRDIASEFEKIQQQQQQQSDRNYLSTTDGKPGMSVADKMVLWGSGAEQSNFKLETVEQPEADGLPQTIEISEAKGQHEVKKSNEVNEVKKSNEVNEVNELPWSRQEEDRDLMIDLELLVINNPNYEWLVRRIRRIALCTTSTVQSAISNAIIKSIEQGRKVSRKMVPVISKASIHLDWDLRAFIQEQAIDATSKHGKDLVSIETIENVITITGSSSEYQALTCGEYLDLVWPELGREVLHAIQAIILYNKANLTLNDGIRITARKNADGMDISLEGWIHAIAEVVEILSWLSAALRTSRTGITTCVPLISKFSSTEQPSLSFRISYSFQTLDSKDNARCWEQMFRTSIVVLGYPTRRRMRMPGLEISLPVLTKLLCSNRINVFNGKLMLKGFSAILIPTDQTEDLVHWHYLYKESGDYLDFSAADSFDGAGVSERDMSKRHIVGWCSDAKVIAGAPGPYYSIKRSRLPKCNASIALKSFSLSAGTQPGAMLEASIAIGIKDRPLHVSPAGLGIVDKLRWISQRYVVLYDSEEKRGWLINGVNALLHLLRTSLESYYTDKFNSALKLKPSDIVEPTTDYPDAAIDFFLHSECKNLQLELYTKRFESFMETSKSSTTPGTSRLKTTSVLVQDRIEDLFDILAHTITQQIDQAKRQGIYFKPYFKKFLDGWDFTNIATDHSPFEPVSARLDCFQQPWVNMIRALNIPVLFGRNLGEIIEPASTDQICSKWTTLPKGKNYLAVTVTTMKEIIERHGDDSTKPMKICENMLWFHPSPSYSPCRCNDHNDNRHIDSVQVVWPEGLKSKLIRHKAVDLPANGAVVFGHNTRFSWFRNDRGTPIEGVFRLRGSENRNTDDEEDEVEPDVLTPGSATQISQSLNTPSNASEGNSSNILSNSAISQQSTAQSNPSLVQQATESSSGGNTSHGSLQNAVNPTIRLKRKASLSWLIPGGKRGAPGGRDS